jgi:hypothetical protein
MAGRQAGRKKHLCIEPSKKTGVDVTLWVVVCPLPVFHPGITMVKDGLRRRVRAIRAHPEGGLCFALSSAANIVKPILLRRQMSCTFSSRVN